MIRCPRKARMRERERARVIKIPGKVILQIKNYTNSLLLLPNKTLNSLQPHNWNRPDEIRKADAFLWAKSLVYYRIFLSLYYLFGLFCSCFFVVAVGISHGVWMKRMYSGSWSSQSHVEMILCQNHVLLAKHSTPEWWRCQSIRGNETYPLYVKSFWHFWVKNKNSSHIIRNFVRQII